MQVLKKPKMSKNLKPIRLVARPDGDDLAELTSDQLQRIGELALEDPL
jgi:hypothetical protein